MSTITCPTGTTMPNESKHTVIGCGANVPDVEN